MDSLPMPRRVRRPMTIVCLKPVSPWVLVCRGVIESIESMKNGQMAEGRTCGFLSLQQLLHSGANVNWAVNRNHGRSWKLVG